MRWLVLGPVWAWLLLFIGLPVLIVLALSFSVSVAGIPPYAPVLTWSGWTPALHLLPDNYQTLVSDRYYLDAALQSLVVAAVSSICCVLIGYPMALGIARAPERVRSLLLLLVMLPFWTGFLLRIVAWIGLLRMRAGSTRRCRPRGSPARRCTCSTRHSRCMSASYTATCHSWSCRCMRA